ncbi:Williams-Beuren syndrome chromosomal region 28 protein like protein [Myotis brandtii]|uniref:Williams-Beuren syndrome chromosomal region 28 protein like protein n=2 Tax=Myotis brandtii TaxID=109478 RepID=S7NB87_MYOBR|nr:Williams-Beuren syndrome chromosomal region 28 protein like protein [Myotis brandtii]
MGILLLVVKLSVLLVQNRVHLYNVLLLKIILFNHWLSGLLQQAQGSCSQQAHPLSELTACPVGSVLRAGLALMEVPVWLVLRVPRLVWAGMLVCARALGLDPKQPGAWEQLGLSAATWMDLLLSCLHSLMLAALLLLLLTCRLLWKAHRCSLGWLPSKVLLENQVVLGLLALMKHLYWWVESTLVVTSWHLAYLVTWTTCLASHLLQAAFEHTAQLAQAQAQAQEAEPQEAGSLFESPFFESLVLKAGPVLPEHETLGE